MSFGFSASDFTGTLQLAWNLYSKCYKISKGAPKDFQCLLHEINMLYSSIQLLRDETADKESILVRAGDERVDMVKRVLGQIDVTLTELKKHSKKYEILGEKHSSSIRKWWAGVRWSVEAPELDALRNKLVYHNGVISLLLTSCGNSSLQRMETITSKVEKGVNDIKDMIRSPAVGAPTISTIQDDRLFSVSLSQTLMKNAEIGRKWSAIGVDEWIQAGSWWLLKSQMDLYTGLPSERKISWQGYANLIKAAWILIDIITRHPQLDFLETSTAYGVELLVETIRRELGSINKSGLARPTLAQLGTCDLAIWETQVKESTLKPHVETSSSGLSRQAWMTENEYVLFQRFGYYQANSYSVESPCIVLFLMHKRLKEAKIVLRDQSWYTWATFIVRDVTPYPRNDVMQIGDQKVRFPTAQDVQHLCAIAEASNEYLFSCKFEENDQEILRSFTLLFSIKNNYRGVVWRLLEDEEPYAEVEKPRENTRAKYSARLLLAAKQLAKLTNQSMLTDDHRVKSTSKNLSLFVWCMMSEYNVVAVLLSEGKGISIGEEDLIMCRLSEPLHNAVRKKNLELIKLLSSERWPDIDSYDPWSHDGFTALEIASQTGLIAAVNILLEAGADLNAGRSQALENAAENGHLDVVNRLLEAGADVNRNRSIALSYAAKKGDLDMVNILLEAGADVSVGGPQALYGAAESGYLDVVNRLLEAGADVNRYSALSGAAQNGHLALVNRLLEAGADVNRSPALSGAAGNGHLDVVSRLLEAGADVNRSWALFGAARNGHLALVNRLLEAGADVNRSWALSGAARNGHLALVNRLLEAGADVNRSSALYGAAESGRLDVVNRLLEAGADVGVGESQALFGAAKSGRLDVVNRLLEAGADVNRSSALSGAAENGHLALVNRLLEAGADVDAGEPQALYGAAERGHLDVVNRLLEAGADVDAGEPQALYGAAESGYLDVVNRLLEAGADVSRSSALSGAAENGHLALVNRLLEAGADVNRNRSIALSYAAKKGDLDMVNILLEAGADVNAGEPQALFGAAEHGHLDIVNRLLEAGANDKQSVALRVAANKNHFLIATNLLKAGANIESLGNWQREKLESWMRGDIITTS